MKRIYKLEEDGVVRYVGVTAKTLRQRLQQHLNEAKIFKRKSHRLHWLRSLFVPPNIALVEQVSPADDAAERERYWISLALAYGCKLVNGTVGGEITNAFSAEALEKISAAKQGEKHPFFGKSRSLETREKIRISNLGQKRSPEQIERMCAAAKKRMQNTELRQRISDALTGWPSVNTGRKHSAAVRANMSAAQKAVIELTAGANQARLTAAAALATRGVPKSLEHRQKISAANAGKKKTDAHKQAMRDGWARRKNAKI